MSHSIVPRVWSFAAGLVALVAAAAPAQGADDLRRAVPAEVHMAVYAKHNPERDYQREYFIDAWKTAREEKICERALKLVTSRVPKDKLEEAQERWEEISEAIEPINGKALANAEEFVFAQQLVGPFNQQMMAFRLSEEDEAEDCKKGITQAFELAEKWSKGKAKVETSDEGDVEITTLRLPKKSPFHPGVAQVGDVIVFSSSPALLKTSIEQLTSDSGESKFDDVRLKEALEHLPEAEDVVTFFDARQLWKGLHGVSDFIREEVAKDDNEDHKEKGERAAKIFERIVDEVAFLDYEVSVEYTEDGQNRSMALGKFTEDAEDTLLGQALMNGEPFEDWQKWTPANTKGFKMSTGVNLHVLYEGILEIANEECPEAERGLEKWAAVQEKIGVNLDEDILQSFSGECVSVRFMVEGAGGKETLQGVTALKCSDPEKVKELLARAFEELGKIPAVKAQGISLVDSDDDELEGFQELKAPILATTGARPVIGFNDGWMILSSHAEAAKQLLAVRAGDEESLADSDLLDGFDIETDKPVYCASYSNIGDGVRTAADMLDKAGTMLPMFVTMAAPKADKEEMAAIQEAIGLLPSIAKVVRKLDFYEDRFSIMQEGPIEDSYIRRSATKIRQPEATAAVSK